MSANFRKGAEAAAEASKGGGNFAKTHFFGLEDGKQAILRFITDAADWIVVDQHQMVPTKGKPDGYEGNWPEKMGSVCRKDEAFSFGECYICEFVVDGKKVKRPSARTWALACEREEVIEDGKIVGLRDKTREVTKKVDDKDVTTVEKSIVVVNMGYKNFFGVLQGFAGHYGTVLDRDYIIQRKGAGTDTVYTIIPLDPIETDQGRFDLRNPEFAKRYETDLDLGEEVTSRASDEFYARFFDPRFSADDKSGEVKQTGAAPDAPKVDNDMDAEKLAALASRVKGSSYAPEGTAPAAAQPAAAASGGGMRDFS